MSRVISSLALCLLIALFLKLPVYGASLYLDTFTSEQGLTQNSINCSIVDSRGFHWFATQSGLNRFDGYHFKKYKSNIDKTGISGNWVTDCLAGKKNHIWFSTASNGLNLLNTQNGKFQAFNQKTNPVIANNQIWSMAKDKQENIWLGHEQGKLTRLNKNKHESEVFSLKLSNNKQALFRDIIIDKNGYIWLASNEGLFGFDPKTHTFTAYSNSPKNLWRLAFNSENQLMLASKKGLSIFDFNNNKFTHVKQFNDIWITDILINSDKSFWLTSYGQGLFYKPADQSLHQKFVQHKQRLQDKNGLENDYLLSLYRDAQGILWIGTDGYGLHRFDDRQRQFGHQKHQSDEPTSLSHDFVRAILKDANGNLWVGTRNGLNKQSQQGFTRYIHQEGNNNSLSNNNIFSLHEDKKGRIWIGTYGGGLLRYEPQSDSFVAYTIQSHQLSSNRVYVITSDSLGNLWLGGDQGLSRFNPDSGHIKHYQNDDAKHNTLSNNTVFSLAYDSVDKALWVGTRKGLNKLALETQKFSYYQQTQSDKKTLSHNMVTSLHLEQPNTVWIGTFQGLNKLNKNNDEIKHVFEQDSLLNQNIFAIKNEKNTHLWLATNQGLIRYQPSSKQIQHFSPADGIQDHSFVLGAAYQGKDGELFFGGIKGFNRFYPDKLNLTAQAPDPVITELLLFNKPVNVALEPSILTKGSDVTTVSYAQKLQFNESHGVIGFQFSALNSAAPPAHYQYAYKLQGLDKQWLYTQAAHRQVNYSQLPAGDYQLLLKTADHYGHWSPSESLVHFSVIPPWWKSTWAYSVYFLLFAAVIWLIIMSRYQIKLAEQASKKHKELNKLKSQFLDNMSHELKTPLSLIIAPLEDLFNRHKDTQSQQALAIIQRNSKQLLMFIEQLLQLSQRPSNVVSLVSPYHFNPILKQHANDFITLFKQKNITFIFKDECNSKCYLNLEHTHLTSIINNLLSNALKYTDNGGTVTLALNSDEISVTICITDTGIGIAKTQQKNIFERFTRLDHKTQSGSGIGLALVKQLVEQYGGSINVSSEINFGSCFSLTLPTANFTDKSEKNVPSLISKIPSRNSLQSSDQKTILIVEDNNDMRILLLSLFSEQYLCISCEDGEQGLAMCHSYVPDVIISDVMMPKMDGYQLLNAVRADIAINHIPVLLLSAKADTQSKIKGLDLLADDYLSKPFEPSLLISRVNALLSVRDILNQHLRQQLQQGTTKLNIDDNMVQSKDYHFTQRLKAVIDEHYQSELFTVEAFAKSLHLSPRALQLKMKALFELTPSDYIRNTRLVYAKELLISSEFSIGLIAEQVGFSSQSYFARCFKSMYGQSPKQFRDQQHKKQVENSAI